MPLGSTLRRLREQKGWTQGQLAIKSRVGQSHISQIERGGSQKVSAEVLAEDLRALASSRSQIIEDDLRSLTQIVGTKRAAIERYRRDYEDGLLDRSTYYADRARLQDELVQLESRLLDLERQRDAYDPTRLEELITGIPPEIIARVRDHWREPEIARPLKALLRQIGLRVHYSRTAGLSIVLSP